MDREKPPVVKPLTLPQFDCGFSTIALVSFGLMPAASASARPHEQFLHAFLLVDGPHSTTAIQGTSTSSSPPSNKGQFFIFFRRQQQVKPTNSKTLILFDVRKATHAASWKRNQTFGS